MEIRSLLIMWISYIMPFNKVGKIVFYVLYASPPIWKLHPHGDIISKLYKPAFYRGYLSCNISYGSTTILWVFNFLWWRYFYSTWSSMTELSLSVSQHWNLCLEYRDFTTKTLSISYIIHLYIRLVVTL